MPVVDPQPSGAALDPPGAAFRLSQVSVGYSGEYALRQVDVEIAGGSVVGFVGPSGAGKTTLLRLLNGSLRPSQGSVSVAGQPLDRMSRPDLKQLRRRIGFVHQDLSLITKVRVAQNVIAGRLGQQGFGRSLQHLVRPSEAVLEEVYGLLERVGIPEKLFERVDRLSGGQQQRVAIARALYQKPNALIADEPVSSVDPARARDVIELLTRISREAGITLCISLHDLGLAREYLSRLVGLRQGRVVFDCASGELEDADFDALYRLKRDRHEQGEG
jgi:phosphonate transport system ATP-binding protein